MTWDPPPISGIDHYIVYVPSQNVMNVSLTRIDVTFPNCRVGNNSIQVAAVNHLGCVGPNSFPIQLTLDNMPPTQDDGLPLGVGGNEYNIMCACNVMYFECYIVSSFILKLLISLSLTSPHTDYM